MNERQKKRFDKEIAEFTERFPDGDLDLIPERIWDEVKNGKNLADAYASYSEDKKKEEARAQIVNEQNAANSSGKIGTKPAKAVYTAKEVAAMSADAIKANYDDIIESMKAKGFYE